MRSASRTLTVTSPQNFDGAEMSSPNCAFNFRAKSEAVIRICDLRFTIYDLRARWRHSNRAYLFARLRPQGGNLQFLQHRLFLDLSLQLDQGVEQRLGPRRTARDVDIHRYNLV